MDATTVANKYCEEKHVTENTTVEMLFSVYAIILLVKFTDMQLLILCW